MKFKKSPSLISAAKKTELAKLAQCDTSKTDKKMQKDCWLGLPEDRFYLYRNWKTRGLLCGSYATAVLLAYYQDYLNPAIIPEKLRAKDSTDYQPLVDNLRQAIQKLGLPTVPVQVGTGLTRFLYRQQIPLMARITHTGNWQRATKRILQGKPVLVSVLGILGSSYGNHWVTAYAFVETENGERFFKVHDNWGGYREIIPAKWVNSTVSLP